MYIDTCIYVYSYTLCTRLAVRGGKFSTHNQKRKSLFSRCGQVSFDKRCTWAAFDEVELKTHREVYTGQRYSKIPIYRAGKGPQPMRAQCRAYRYASKNRSVSFLLCAKFRFIGRAWARSQCVHSAEHIVMRANTARFRACLASNSDLDYRIK